MHFVSPGMHDLDIAVRVSRWRRMRNCFDFGAGMLDLQICLGRPNSYLKKDSTVAPDRGMPNEVL
jgi:hypothetical protein